MKKKTISKLALQQETLRRLVAAELLRAVGGEVDVPKVSCPTNHPASGCA